MNNFIDYFYDKKAVYLFSFLYIGIFYLILFLYGVLIDAIVYATILCFTCLIIYFIYDYYHYYQRRKQLESYMQHKDIYVEQLPLPQTSIEEKYQELLIQMSERQQYLKEKTDKDYQNTLQYFTLWVHQIKTPISALRLLIQSEYTANDLYMQLLKIEQYVEMSLHYIKMEHMTTDLRLKKCQLSDLLNEVIKKQATFFVYKKIKLQLDPIDYIVLTDEKWISFVLEQILSNALKYTKHGSIHIYMNNETLYIEDTGIGIKQEDIPRIFEKGFTGYNGRLDKKASGLGLYLCKQIIDNLGFQIEVHSQVDKGTVVCINFHIDSLQVE